jgi:hypothetical protein
VIRHWSALLDETWRKRNAVVAAETRADKVRVVAAKMVATTTENHADHDVDVVAVVAAEITAMVAVAANQLISQATHR